MFRKSKRFLKKYQFIILAARYHGSVNYSQFVLLPGITLKNTHCDLTGSNEHYIVFDWGKWYLELSLEVL